MKKKGGWRNCPEVESLLLTAPAEDQIPSVHVRWLITACNSSFKDPMCTHTCAHTCNKLKISRQQFFAGLLWYIPEFIKALNWGKAFRTPARWWKTEGQEIIAFWDSCICKGLPCGQCTKKRPSG